MDLPPPLLARFTPSVRVFAKRVGALPADGLAASPAVAEAEA